MWFKSYNATGDVSGRVSSGHIKWMEPVGATGAYFIQATLVDGSTRRVSTESFPTFADALAGIDDLLLNGS